MSVRSLANSKATTPLSDDATRISPSELGPHAKRMRSDLDSDLDPDLASAMASGLLGVVKNDADGMTQPAADPADAVSEIDAVCAFRAFHRPIVDGEDHGIAVRQRHTSLRLCIHGRWSVRENSPP